MSDDCVSILHSVNHLTVSYLALIKWKDDKGNSHRFRLIDEICMYWRDMGMYLGIPVSMLDVFREKTLNNPIECCQQVISYWLESDRTLRYPKKWDGVYELLTDIKCSQIAENLREAVAGLAMVC